MPVYVDELTQDDKIPCQGLRDDLKSCLLASDCVKLQKKTPRQCLNVSDGSVPDKCFLLKTSFFECKRSLIDNRNRFRGRKE